MENSLTTILSVIVGGAITFLASYILEARRIKNDKFKFTLEKTISVGEEFYRFSSYALLQYQVMLDSYENMEQYDTQSARDVLAKVDANVKALIQKIADNFITITVADIFFGVSDIEIATLAANKYKHTQAAFMEKVEIGTDTEATRVAFNNMCAAIREFITLIQGDRLKIKNKINELLELQKKKSN